ncbi:hypothetical protein QJS10_CPB04g01876 [Acorus calamus]|uniref:Uncharacterized protein n=1 Tax=Acorus calamus TaxID=4465 RepID=A0AAV9F036_ACOCL|nr:hypothetical protein QJS10_CPB04g01876 [Acorus calamus]
MDVKLVGGLSNRFSLRSSLVRTRCSREGSQPPPPSENGKNSNQDWDKAWSNFQKKGKKTLFSQFNPNKYVSWNPRRSEYPLSEEVDPIKRTERSNLMLWTSPQFTLAGAIIVVTTLLIYTIIAPIPVK